MWQAREGVEVCLMRRAAQAWGCLQGFGVVKLCMQSRALPCIAAMQCRYVQCASAQPTQLKW